MKYFILLLSLFSILFFASVMFLPKINLKIKEETISSYYNNKDGFAGFVQERNGLIRACEFSTNGTILSCSKWFDSKSLKQGQNEGLSIQDI